MKVYTKKGDSGETSLIGGVRVKKDSVKIESYGTTDELNSYIGLIRDQEIKEDIKLQLIEIQDRLFTIGSYLASHPEKSKMSLPTISEQDVEFLENAIDEIEEQLEPMRSFVLPGGHTTVSFCHIARCVCRRAERLIVSLSQIENTPEIILKYMNRLSDYLFVLGRRLSKELNAKETPWIPRK